MSTVKRLLRNARECLGRREYRDTLQHCKEALAEDKSCYEAYIYVGKAAFHLQEYVQAEAAYRRAADLDPRNPLAWQGLAELFTETGSWPTAAECYTRLVKLADTAPTEDVALRGRRTVFQRRAAEAAARGGLLAEAEAGWRALAEAAGGALAAAKEGGGGGDGGDEAAVAAAEGELVDCLCRLADVQLSADAAEIEARVAARLGAEAEALTPGVALEQVAALESAVRGAVEGEWAEEALELDADHASSTLRRIIALRPPSPPYVPYYDAFLKRLRKYIQAASPGSMERHSRRAVLLAAAKATLEGRCGNRTGGCCSPYAYEAALAMLEVEHEVAGEQDPSLDTASLNPTLEPPPLPSMVADCGCIASHLAHSFPWSATAQLHTALSLRRRAAVYGFDAAATGCAVARLPPAVPTAAAAVASTTSAGGGRRKQVTAMLLSALSRGGRGVSGWLAACELLLEEGAAEAALDAAKEGLKYVAHRDLVGKERLAGAGLLLRLLAGLALLRLRKLEEALLLLEGLAHGVSEGHVASGELAGIPPVNICQQGKRFLAHVAAARGDLAGARHRYDELVGGQLMGRSAAPLEAWVHGELGMLLLRQGAAVEGARFHLQSALAALQPALDAAAAAAASPAATALLQLQQEAATYQIHLALALWVKGGGRLLYNDSTDAPSDTDATAAGTAAAAAGPSLEPYRSDCRELLLSAAAVPGPLQAAAFTWLGHWYDRASEHRDELKARRCYQRALALDPTQAEAGEALVAALRAAGRSDTAVQLCEEMRARATVGGAAAAAAAAAGLYGPASLFLLYPSLLPAAVPATAGGAGGGSGGGGAGWALRSLARLQRDGGSNEAAVVNFQAAIRLEPADSELWEGLAAAYQALGRHTAALKSYGRALELSPGRLFSRLQAAALHYQMGEMPAALSYYRKALTAAPGNAAGLLGCGEVLLAQAALAARMGAAAAAAAELAEAAELAARATGQYGDLQAGWKLLGDVRMQHAAVPTLDSVVATRGSVVAPSDGVSGAAAAVRTGLAAARNRLSQLRSARRAYAAAVHLDPRVSGLWGDLGMSYHLELELEGQHPELAADAQEGERIFSHRPRRDLALALARGGLRLDPTSDWLWSCSGTIAAAAAADSPAMAAAAEYCYSRALQLNPRRAPVWAALGRLYACHGEGGLASRCFDAARSHEPTSIAVWEAMGDAALRRGGGGPLGGATSTTTSTYPRVATAAWRDAADAYEHAQLLGGDVESRLGFVLGSLLTRGRGGRSNNAAVAAVATAAADSGTVLAAATKTVEMHPLLASAHHSRGLALEARGDYASAVQALQIALVLVDDVESINYQQQQSESCSSSSTPSVLPFDPRVSATVRVAVQLDLARVLVAAGRSNEAIALYDALRQQDTIRPHDFGAALSYATALQQAGRSTEALTHLIAVLSDAAAPPRLRIVAATAAVRIHIAARRWDEAYGIVLTVLSDLPDEGHVVVVAGGGGSAAEGAAKLWRVLLAGLVTARAPELESQLLTAMRQWTACRRDLDTAQHECRVHELLSAKHRAAGAATAALRQAARAVRACPYDRSAWALLSHTAAQATGPRHAVLAARAAPRDKAPYTAAVADENTAPSLAAPLGAAPLTPSAAAAHAAGVTAAVVAGAAAKGNVGASGIVLLAAVREAAARMRRVVHAQPHEASAWYLCALTEVQHAIASGGHVRLYRSAVVAARAAVTKAKAELAALTAEPPTTVAAAPPPPPPGLWGPPGLPPVLALAMSAQAARAHTADADPRVAALRAQRAALADVCVRSMAVLSECRLQLQLRGHGVGVGVGVGVGAGGCADVRSGAQEAAEEALSVAASHGVDSSHAHRQMARLHLAQGDLSLANAAYEQACRAAAAAASSSCSSIGPVTSYELLHALEWAAVRAAAGDTTAAAQLLSTALSSGSAAAAVVQPRPAVALANVASVQRALFMLQIGEVEAARAAAAEAAAGGPAASGVGSGAAVWQPSPGLRSAVHSVQAAAALVQATLVATTAEAEDAAGPAAMRKKSLLEARWAAREALKPLSLPRPAGQLGHRGSAPPPGPSGPGAAFAVSLLGWAEAGLGKEEAARELYVQARRLWPDQSEEPVEVLLAGAARVAKKTSTSDAAAAAFASQPYHSDGGNDSGSDGGSLARSSDGLHCSNAPGTAVHCRPWAFVEAWTGMAAAARAQ